MRRRWYAAIVPDTETALSDEYGQRLVNVRGRLAARGSGVCPRAVAKSCARSLPSIRAVINQAGSDLPCVVGKRPSGARDSQLALSMRLRWTLALQLQPRFDVRCDTHLRFVRGAAC